MRFITETNSPSSFRHNLQNNKTHQKQKHVVNKFFNAVESPCRQQFNQQAELGLVAFIHKKKTLFLGYNGNDRGYSKS
jgi:hypothetical protein